MSEDPDPPETPHEMDVTPARGRLRGSLSIVWIVPVIALIVSLAVAWRAYSDRGVLIHVTFENAAGLVPGQSVLKYRDVTVGKVEKVGFTPDLSRVLVSVRVDKQVARRIGQDAQFWIVRPQIGFGGITGLNTVLSGVFIEGQWGKPPNGPAPTWFTGVEQAPLAVTPNAGIWVTISAPDGGALIDGAPVLLRGIKVGELRNIRLDPSGHGVLVDAFVKAPYDKWLTSASKFWDTSGFSVSLGASGVKLHVGSLSALIQGGVEFESFAGGGTKVKPHHVFRLYSDEAKARESVFLDTGAPRVSLSIVLEHAVEGLKAGDAVTFRGLKVGEVSDLAVQVARAPNGRRIVKQRVDFTVSPERMGLGGSAGQPELMSFLRNEVAGGLRARVTAMGFLGGSLEIALVDVPNAAKAALDTGAKPYPVLPSVAPSIPDISTSAEGALARIKALPIEQLMNSAISVLDSVNKLVNQSDTQKAPGALIGLLDDMRGVVGSPALQSAPEALNKALTGADQFFAALKKADAVGSIVSAMNRASEAAQAVSDSAKGVPKLVDTYTALGEKASKLPLDALVSNANDLVVSLNRLTASDQMAKLPQSLNQALGSLNRMLDALRQGGAVENLNSTLSSADRAAEAVKQASDQLPALVKRLDAVVAQADGVLSSYGPRSSFNADTLDTLRKLRDAAESIAGVARMIQRNPQAFILGR